MFLFLVFRVLRWHSVHAYIQQASPFCFCTAMSIVWFLHPSHPPAALALYLIQDHWQLLRSSNLQMPVCLYACMPVCLYARMPLRVQCIPLLSSYIHVDLLLTCTRVPHLAWRGSKNSRFASWVLKSESNRHCSVSNRQENVHTFSSPKYWIHIPN